MFENDNITPEVEDDVLMPEGYAEGDDIFASSDEWTGEAQVDAPETEPAPESEEPEGEQAEAPTPEPETAAGDEANEEEAPTPEQNTPEANKLKFKARVDRVDVDVELDESELPTVYQKAQATDRYQAKLAQQTPILDKAERLSKALGFDNFEAMLANAEQSYRDSKVQELTQGGTPKEIAEDYVARKLADVAPAAKESEQLAAQETPTRDFEAEARELVKARPDLAGTKLPDEVVRICVSENKPLVAAYSEYEARQQKAEADKLRRENAILKQNAASAARAPVKGVRGGGATDTKAEDDFMRGFNAEY